jgi:hypothetical protein
MPTPKKKPTPPKPAPGKNKGSTIVPRSSQGGSPLAAGERERIKQFTNWLQASDVGGPNKSTVAKRRQDGIKKFGEAYSSAMGTAQTYGGYKPKSSTKPKPPTKISKIDGSEGPKRSGPVPTKKKEIKTFNSFPKSSSKGGMNAGKSIIDLAGSAGKTAAGLYAKGYNILGAGLPAKVVKGIGQAGKGSTAGGFMQSAVKSKPKPTRRPAPKK